MEAFEAAYQATKRCEERMRAESGIGKVEELEEEIEELKGRIDELEMEQI